jgi:predicted PurR-regulated permease PerM
MSVYDHDHRSNPPEHSRSREAVDDARPKMDQREPFVRRMLMTVGVVAAVVLLLVFLSAAVRVLFLVFAGLLLAVLLRALSDLLSRYTSIRQGLSLAIVVLGLISLLGVGAWLLAPQIMEQVGDLGETLTESVQQLRQRLDEYEWSQQLLPEIPAPEDMGGNQGEIVTQVANFFSITLGVLVEVVVVLFIGLYLAATPQLYVHGLLRLVPISKRDRAREVIDRVGYTLRWWLLGQLFAMSVVGLLATLGLWLLDVPLALVFGFLTFLLTFIPYIGAIASAVPPTLTALTEGTTLALYVLLLYIVVQNLEGYVLTPLIHRGTVLLPPALTIVTQVLFGVLFGILGVMLATPFIAIVLVLVKMLYIEDVLGDPIMEEEEGDKEEDESSEKQAEEQKINQAKDNQQSSHGSSKAHEKVDQNA